MRDWMERQQSWIYLIFILAGLAVGLSQPDTTSWLEAILWPLLGGLLYATFTQVPLTRIGQGLKDWRFLAALLLGNFVVIPLVLGGMMTFIPLPPVVQAGVLLVLLVPCTDWCISFTHLGKGDAGRAIAATPVLLLVQLLALPVYLWLFLGVEWFQTVLSSHLLGAFAGLIITPLALAWVTERLAERHLNARRWVHGLGMLPVPLLALVVFVIAASQVTTVAGLSGVLLQVLLIFVVYLIFAAFLGKTLGRLFQLPTRSARTLTFSFGTRNSFVVLPIALTLPEAWQAAVVVIVFQSLVELFGMVVYLRWMGKLIPELSHT
ncbi:arsenic resistance protein [Halomonas sp. 5021]|jgi:ACR3 family arsenite efflux pump ArsB|uniref:arsenic resistance protein n=1 Tax=Halomonadaceae TaxID=28256 RepID=UPI00109FAAB3|nr:MULTISPECIES: arsenic resistance protein [Halomonas]QPL46186.1 arsenic resistance protein [Halomonas sp. A40-4]|tara:strand:- start:3658 stop:4620 length:963 start_codon:yes stop_codon:yes gene_type:complete